MNPNPDPLPNQVLALAYSHGARRLFSAASDGGLCAYDVLHSYQPCRAYAASPHADSPCLAVCADDQLLAVGGLQPHSLLVFQSATLSLLRAVSLEYAPHLPLHPQPGPYPNLRCAPDLRRSPAP